MISDFTFKSNGDGTCSIAKYVGHDTKIDIPAKSPSGDNVTSIGDCAFYKRTSLTSVTIPDSVTSIDSYAFTGCTSLASAIIPDSVTSIGDSAFAFCASLTSIIIPNSVTNIDRGAFWGCTGLRKYESIAFKSTDGNMSCRGFQYKLDKRYKERKSIELCTNGFHSCRSPFDIFTYYCGHIGVNVRLWLVKPEGKIVAQTEGDSKICSEEITFIKELTISELADYASGRKEM